ncbi:MAG: outer membrane lipid asymmetry maintenance protein MlaD [Alphaproteobacteria bacterium]
MNKKPIETLMGILVIIIAAFFLVFALRLSDLKVVKGYSLTANFLKVGGLNVGSDVRINGIKVGTVTSQNLDNEKFEAVLNLSIASNISLPTDSSAIIVGDGLMGDKFIKIEPGRSKEFLKDGDILTNTKDFKSLEDMVGEVIFMVTENE